ncbi:hypothetical protein F4802DRAFT_588130 [Xylaria palmicola]|nr:hypothetical protein F4802DRAFT_588130 [Xylaria palmicola]
MTSLPIDRLAWSIEFSPAVSSTTVQTDVGGPGNSLREISFRILISEDSKDAEARLAEAYEATDAATHLPGAASLEETDQDARIQLQEDGTPTLPAYLLDIHKEYQISARTVDMKQFMIITAVTQNAINSALSFMARQGSGIRKITATEEQSTFKGKVETLLIELDPTRTNMAFLYLQFLKGTSKLSPTPAGNSKQSGKDVKTYDMKDWKVVFDVNISTLSMTTGDSDYSAVSQQIANASKHSLLRLILNLATASPKELNKSKSSIPDVDSERLTTFLHLLDLWRQGQTKTEKQTFAYVWTSNNPQDANPAAPTFVATDMKLQSFKSSQTDSVSSIPGGRNVLLYLEMAFKEAMPGGAFTSSEELVPAGDAGSMRVCRELFFGRYLLDGNRKLLQRVNEWTDVTAVGTGCSYSLTKKTYWFHYGIGRNWDKPDSFYQWKPLYLFGTLLPTIWYWSDSSEKTSTGGGSMFGMKIQLICYTYNLAYRLNQSTIRVQGRSSVSEQVWVYAIITNWMHVRVEVDWSFDLTMDSVESGKLGISVSELKKKVNTYQDSGMLMPVDQLKADLNRLGDSIRVDQVRSQIATSLSGNSQFVLPGAKQFFMEYPGISGLGDLVATLTYKNVVDGGDNGDTNSSDSDNDDDAGDGVDSDGGSDVPLEI